MKGMSEEADTPGCRQRCGKENERGPTLPGMAPFSRELGIPCLRLVAKRGV
jgi:hypothetical protein